MGVASLDPTRAEVSARRGPDLADGWVRRAIALGRGRPHRLPAVCASPEGRAMPIRSLAVAALATAVLFGPAAAHAITLDYQPLNAQSSSSIVQVAGGVTVTAHAFGGVANPQASMTPTGT